MIVKNNYNECITNFACSIRKYFNLPYQHNTLSYIDEILTQANPKNVITILCDGMGSNIIDNVLDKNSFLISHRLKTITSVFPATTVAATTSMTTGLNPVETAMLGWDTYFKELDKTITTFLCTEKGDTTETILPKAVAYKEKHMITKTITEEINEAGEYTSYSLFPFGNNPYTDRNDMFDIIETKCKEDGKKYIYAYDPEPDHSMHEYGTYSEQANNLIIELNNKIEKLSKKLDDTIIFVIADHGHKNIKNIDLNEYPDIVNCLKRTTSLEPRAVNFFIKEDKKEQFEKLFSTYFSEDFDLYPMSEVIESQLFGDGLENDIFRDALGDYLAIATGDKTIVYGGNELLKSHHAGYTDDEILIPLIVVDTNKNNSK